MKVEKAKTADLTSDPKNARKHNEKNIESIAASLQAFGQQKPIVVDKHGIVIAGNGTLEAARSIGWIDINIVRTELEGSQATAFGIADNRTGELAEWDKEELANILSELQQDNDDLSSSLGFSDEEITRLVDGSEIQMDIDEEDDGFAEGDQFGDKVSIEITTTQSALDAGIKKDVILLCEKHALTPRFRGGGK